MSALDGCWFVGWLLLFLGRSGTKATVSSGKCCRTHRPDDAQMGLQGMRGKPSRGLVDLRGSDAAEILEKALRVLNLG